MEAAREVGIEPEAVERVITELEAEVQLKEELTKLRSERRRDLASNFATWAIVNTGLFGIDWATGGGWWFFWPLGSWGIFLLLRLKGELFANATQDRQMAERRIELRRRQREREQAEARRRSEREKRQGSGGLEGVIERGVEELLGAAARRIAGRVRVEAGELFDDEPEARRGARRRGGWR